MISLPNDARISDLFQVIRDTFRDSGIDTPELDARLLILTCIGMSHAEFIAYPDRRVSAEQKNELLAAVKARCARIPMSHILGLKEFYGREFVVDKHTLTPRPDSEVLIDVALDFLKNVKNPRILDLGTGTGCLLLTLLAECEKASGDGVDVSVDALKVARENAARLGVKNRCNFVEGSWFECINGTYDLIVSNPPYIETHEIEGLQKEVKDYEPHLALDGGVDGLIPYRVIIPSACNFLRKGGMLLFEIGSKQKDQVEALFLSEGQATSYSNISSVQDLGGRDRCVYATC